MLLPPHPFTPSSHAHLNMVTIRRFDIRSRDPQDIDIRRVTKLAIAIGEVHHDVHRNPMLFQVIEHRTEIRTAATLELHRT